MARSLLDQFETAAAATERYATHEAGRPVLGAQHAPPPQKTMKKLVISTPEIDVLMKCTPEGDPSSTETFVFFMRTKKGMELGSDEYDAAALLLRKKFEQTVGRTLVRWQFDPMCGGVDTRPRKVMILDRETQHEVERTVYDSIPKPGGWRGEWL